MEFTGIPSRNFYLTIIFSLLFLNEISSQRYRNPDREIGYQDPNPIVFRQKPQESYLDNYPQNPGVPQYGGQTQRTESPRPSFAQVGDAVTDFSLNMLKEIARNPQGNIVTSPISMATVLALLQQGTTGNALQELVHTLGMDKETAKNSYANIVENIRTKKSKNEISFANAVFVNNGYRLSQNFSNIAVRDFRAPVEPVDFKKPGQAAARINEWVNRQTAGRIPGILRPESIDANTDCVLVNAVYFKGVWQNTFAADRTVPRPFQPLPGREVSCSFMHQSGKFVAGEDKNLGAKWLELPFDKNEFSMYLILPTEQHELNSLINKLTSSDLGNILQQKNLVTVTMSIPKFNINYEAPLTGTLQNMGIRQIFSHNSGITDLSPGKQVQVSQALQRAGMAIDEHGSVAAAASALAVNTLSLSSYLDEFRFVANQPFLAIIVDKRNNVPIFMARIDDPTKPF